MSKFVYDLVGKKFEGWTVIGPYKDTKEDKINPHHRTMFMCLCECGKVKRVRATYLTTGRSTNCGCRRIYSFTKRPFESLYNKLIQVANKRKYPVNLSYEEYCSFTTQTVCHYCSFPIYWVRHAIRPGLPGHNLDRKDNDLGYSKENCVVCCGDCNRTKGDRFTYEEFILLSPILREIQKRRNK